MVTQIQLGNLFNNNGKTVLGGSNSGIDTEALLKGLTEAKRLPAAQLEDKIKLNTDKKAAFSELEKILGRFKDAANFLRNPPGVLNSDQNVFAYRQSTLVSNSAVDASAYASVTVEPGTNLQNYTINSVTQLARATKQESNVFAIASASDQVVFTGAGAGQFEAGTITVNGQNITLDDGDSLQTVSNKFNALKNQTGISSSVIQVAAGQYKLVFSATKTGLSADFDLANAGTVTDPGGVLANVTFTTTQNAQNAQFTIDNVVIDRESNSIADAVDGITITLKQATPVGTTLDLSIVPDNELVKTAITNFVDSYNEFRLYYARQTETSENGSFTEGAVLGNNSTLRSTLNSISSELNRSVAGIAGGALARIGDLGITFSDFPGDEDQPFTRNIMTINEAKLESAIASNFDEVRKVFEFDFTSSSSRLQVFSRTNSLNVTDFSLNVDQVGGIYQATYTLGGVLTTVDLDATALSGGGGLTLKGKSGTALDGLVLLYSGNTSEVITAHVSQGIGDRLYNYIGDILKDEQGIDLEVKNLDDSSTRYQKEIDRIDAQVEIFRQQLLEKFANLEKALSSVNSLLEALDAQSQARASA